MYYVYLHKKPNGEVFYVGKGTKKRAWSKHNRNKFWNCILKKYGEFIVEIIADNLQEWYAFELEHETILKYGLVREGGTLVNMSYGGEGLSGYIATPEHCEKISKANSGTGNGRADKTVYNLTFVSTGEVFNGTRQEFTSKYGINIQDIFKKPELKTVLGWCLTSKLHLITKPKFDPNLYTFCHDLTGETITSTRRDFKRRTGVEVKTLFKEVSPNHVVKGWRLVK